MVAPALGDGVVSTDVTGDLSTICGEGVYLDRGRGERDDGEGGEGGEKAAQVRHFGPKERLFTTNVNPSRWREKKSKDET